MIIYSGIGYSQEPHDLSAEPDDVTFPCLVEFISRIDLQAGNNKNNKKKSEVRINWDSSFSIQAKYKGFPLKYLNIIIRQDRKFAAVKNWSYKKLPSSILPHIISSFRNFVAFEMSVQRNSSW